MPIYNYAESVYVGTKTIYPSKYILTDGILYLLHKLYVTVLI